MRFLGAAVSLLFISGCVGHSGAYLDPNRTAVFVQRPDPFCGPVVLRRAATGAPWGEYLTVTVDSPGPLQGEARLFVDRRPGPLVRFGEAPWQMAAVTPDWTPPAPWVLPRPPETPLAASAQRAVIVDAVWVNDDPEVRGALAAGAPLELSVVHLEAAGGRCDGVSFTIEQGVLEPNVSERAWMAELERRGGPELVARREARALQAEEDARLAAAGVRAGDAVDEDDALAMGAGAGAPTPTQGDAPAVMGGGVGVDVAVAVDVAMAGEDAPTLLPGDGALATGAGAGAPTQGDVPAVAGGGVGVNVAVAVDVAVSTRTSAAIDVGQGVVAGTCAEAPAVYASTHVVSAVSCSGACGPVLQASPMSCGPTTVGPVVVRERAAWVPVTSTRVGVTVDVAVNSASSSNAAWVSGWPGAPGGSVGAIGASAPEGVAQVVALESAAQAPAPGAEVVDAEAWAQPTFARVPVAVATESFPGAPPPPPPAPVVVTAPAPAPAPATASAGEAAAWGIFSTITSGLIHNALRHQAPPPPPRRERHGARPAR